MPNRPGRPCGGPPLEQRAAEYKVLRERGMSYQEAAEAMGVSRQAIRWYAKHLRDTGQLPPAECPAPKSRPTSRAPRSNRCRAALLEHLRRWPDSLFSAWELRRILDGNVYWALAKLSQEGLVEVVDGMRHPEDRRVRARRYRLALAKQEASDA